MDGGLVTLPLPGSVEVGGMGVEGAYALSDRLRIHAGAASLTGMKMFDAGGSYAVPLGRFGMMDIGAGWGRGWVHRSQTIGTSFGTTSHRLEARWDRPFIQPSIGYSSLRFEIVAGARVGWLHHSQFRDHLEPALPGTAIKPFADDPTVGGTRLLIEPSCAIRFGGPRFRFEIQYTHTTQHGAKLDMTNHDLSMGLVMKLIDRSSNALALAVQERRTKHALDTIHQQRKLNSIWKARPRYHLSAGVEEGYFEIPNEVCMGCEKATAGLRLGGLVRIKDNWLIGASYSDHGNQATSHELARTDLVNGWFGTYVVNSYRNIMVDQKVHGYELTVGRSIPQRWPRRWIHATGALYTGVRMLRIHEEHEYGFGPTFGYPDARVSVSSTGWTWTLRLRGDLHLSKHFSFYTDLAFAQPFVLPDLPSSAIVSGEEMRIEGARKQRRIWISYGIALHL